MVVTDDSSSLFEYDDNDDADAPGYVLQCSDALELNRVTLDASFTKSIESTVYRPSDTDSACSLATTVTPDHSSPDSFIAPTLNI